MILFSALAQSFAVFVIFTADHNLRVRFPYHWINVEGELSTKHIKRAYETLIDEEWNPFWKEPSRKKF